MPTVKQKDAWHKSRVALRYDELHEMADWHGKESAQGCVCVFEYKDGSWMSVTEDGEFNVQIANMELTTRKFAEAEKYLWDHHAQYNYR